MTDTSDRVGHPAGWLPDPWMRGRMRWWDGEKWAPTTAPDWVYEGADPDAAERITTAETTAPTGARKRPRRPRFAMVVAATLAVRFGREIVYTRYGFVGAVAAGVALVAIMIGWRLVHLNRVRAQGGDELTPQAVVAQLSDSGLGGPAFVEDGTLLGASVLAVNQRTKVLELNTEYDVFGSDGNRLATVHQIGQSKAKLIGRLFTPLDQYFTHHFDVMAPNGLRVMRLTRPRKVFLTKVHVFDGADRFLGTIGQQNIFWKIKFVLTDPSGRVVGRMQADKLQAWDFQVLDPSGRTVASIVKSWEGWGRTAFTRADRYSARLHGPIQGHLRPLAIASALAVDLALKQDSRGFS